MARFHDLFSLIPGIIASRQLATCSKVLKLSSKTITRASGYFAFFVFGSKTVVGDVVEKSIVTAFVFDLDLLSTSKF